MNEPTAQNTGTPESTRTASTDSAAHATATEPPATTAGATHRDSASFCPQCALRELQAALTPERIQAQALSMQARDGITTLPDEYERRLSVCARCERLQGSVLCAECGSYVAYRARLSAATCPYPGGSRWA